MKNLLLSLISICLLGASSVFAQIPVWTFEDGDPGGWWAFGGAEDNFEIVENPLYDDVNGSDNVMMMIAPQGAESWAGMANQDSLYVFSETDSVMEVKVYKSVLSPFAVKFEQGVDGAGNFEVPVTNTVVDQWELLKVVMPQAKGKSYAQITVLPDYWAREAETTTYFDDIKIGVADEPQVAISENQVEKSISVFPNPANEMIGIKGISGSVSYEIANIQGQTVKSGVIYNHALFVNDLESGLYIITVKTNSGMAVSKFMKR